MTYFVYLIVSNLKNNKKISYVGYTNNLKKRIKLHNSGKGAKFTRGKKWKLVYYEKYDSKSACNEKEYILKKNYKLKKKIIKNINENFYSYYHLKKISHHHMLVQFLCLLTIH